MSVDLDPDDWATFRAAAHRLLDQCVDHLKSARDHPWQPLPEAVRDSYSIAGQGSDPAQLADRLAKDVLPYGTGNTRPRFFGWVHGTGLATGIMSEMVADVVSNLCVFTADGTLSADSQSTLNTHIAKALQNRGHTVFSTTLVAGITCLRAAITNHRTTSDDARSAVSAVAEERDNTA